ncbi:tellurite resistance TerB family protein [Candidatus Sororendozoicomonas aggregata]|uniref:tellurite resistance TerB family protein n=1 Tax=Candidatus Sororendozoicomonas aggregata TaxID=3073239 RepID=UPI002ED2F29C
MDVKNLLGQLLRSDATSSLAKQGTELLNKTRNKPVTEKGSGSILSKLGTGAAGGGALAMLLSKKGRNIGGKALVAGGTVGLGALAYKAYKNWQNKSSEPVTTPVASERVFLTHTVSDDDAIILRAMIGAAKADGHIDAREKTKIQEAVQAMGKGNTLEQFVTAELEKPLDPAEIASAATTPEVKAQVYLASVLVADEQNFMERTYLQELARLMDLQPGLVKELEQQVAAS